MKFYYSRVHGEYRYSTNDEKDLTLSRLAIPWLRRTPLASRGAMFDVVGLWLLYGMGEHPVVFSGWLVSRSLLSCHEKVRCRGRVRTHATGDREKKLVTLHRLPYRTVFGLITVPYSTRANCLCRLFISRLPGKAEVPLSRSLIPCPARI